MPTKPMPALVARRAPGSSLQAGAPDQRANCAGEPYVDAVSDRGGARVPGNACHAASLADFRRPSTRAWRLIVVAKRMIWALFAEAVIAKRIIWAFFAEAVAIIVAKPMIWTLVAETTQDDQFGAKTMI